MRLHCPVHTNIKLQIVGMANQKPLYCKECNKSYTIDEAVRPQHD